MQYDRKFCLWSNGKIALGQNKDKHDQCKADYLKAKREDPADRIIADALQERGNQDAVWGGPEHDDLHDPRDWVHFIRVYATKAKMEDSKSNHSKYKHRMIQIIALGVSAILSFNRKEKDGETQ